MKKVLRVAFVALIAAVSVLPASAQLKFGPKIGVCVNELKFSEDIIKGSNRAGFTGGLMAEFTAPVIGIGVDVSAMYVRRSSEYMASLAGVDTPSQTVNQDYIDIPVNVKYKLSLPFVKPMIFTGPDFAFRASKEVVNDMLEAKAFDLSWNFGLGVEVCDHLQVAASYSIGLTKALQTVYKDNVGAGIEGKNRYWTLTAAYLF